jgi:hypothetical protein
VCVYKAHDTGNAKIWILTVARARAIQLERLYARSPGGADLPNRKVCVAATRECYDEFNAADNLAAA